jgi:hypothetical protein
MKTAFKLSAIVIAAAFVFAPGAEASHKSGHDKGPKTAKKVEHEHSSKEKIKIKRGDEVEIKIEHKGAHKVQHAAGPKNCPPGLAKKGNGCLPPGQAKKIYGSQSAAPFAKPRYRIGDRFDEGVPYYVLRRSEYDRYNVPDFDGQYYVRTEDRLLRLDRKTNAVIDIISGLNELVNN